jgi:putative ABC transport system substrate-binding protein
MQRREFIALLGGAAAAWPLAARAQQPGMPTIGFLNGQSPDGYTERLRGFRQGLKEVGFNEGENVAIEYRWAEGQVDRLPALAADLVRRRVNVIAASGGGAVVVSAAKAATTTVPIVFGISEDPVKLGLVASLPRPGGNLTGVNFLNTEVTGKRLELLRALVPAIHRVAVLVDPGTANVAEGTERDASAAAGAMGLQIEVFAANTSREIDAAFAKFAVKSPDALFVTGDSLFNSRRIQLAHLATYHRIPATYASRDYTDIGGLMSYGTNVTDAYRQLGIYAGRVLRGTKPADLPVIQSSKFELVINNQTARTLGLTVPQTLLAIADEVIE